MAATPSAIQAFSRAVAEQATVKYGVPGGVIAGNSRIATGIGMPFTKDLAEDFKTYLPLTTDARPVVLVGYPDLEPTGDSGGGDDDDGGGGSTGKWDQVVLAFPTHTGYGTSVTWHDAVCPAGKQKIVSWPSCSPSWGQGFIAYGSDIGTVTFGMRYNDTYSVIQGPMANRDDCKSHGTPASCARTNFPGKTTTTYVDIYLNGALIGLEGNYDGRCYITSESIQGWMDTTGTYCLPEGTPSTQLQAPPRDGCAYHGTYSYAYGSTTWATKPMDVGGGKLQSALCGVPL